MRALVSAVVVLTLGCGAPVVPAVVDGTPCPEAVPTARERLEELPVAFELTPGLSFGTLLTRQVMLDASAAVALRPTSGWLEVSASNTPAGELLTVSRFEGALRDVELPGLNGLTLTGVRFHLAAPATLAVRWLTGGEVGWASGTVPVDIHTSLRLSSGAVSPLEVGHLPALPMEFLVQRTTSGALLVSASVEQRGTLWTWGGLYELAELAVKLEAVESGVMVELPTTPPGFVPR